MLHSLMKPYQNYSLKFLMKFEISHETHFTDNYIHTKTSWVNAPHVGIKGTQESWGQ